ncbi:MAG: C4-type zinc ribbon domain-containing protein [Thermodesulfobacteriota bacterium]
MEQVRFLIEMQEVMSQARRLEEEKRKIPLEVADLKSLFEEREAAFLSASQEFEALRQQRREKEREIEEEKEKVDKAKVKLMAIKTNKEYYAMLKEIEGTRRTNTAREEELLAVLSKHEEAEKRLAERKAELDEVTAKYRERMVEIEARMGSFDQDIAKILDRKRQVASKLDAGLVRRFEMIFERREGLAIIAATNYSCTGCHMNISPQLFNLLQREDRIHTCPNCNRILYYVAAEDKASGE